MVTVNGSSLSVDIRDLLKFSEYRILVSGFTSKGDGDQSEVRAWTDEDGKLSFQQITVLNILKIMGVFLVIAAPINCTHFKIFDLPCYLG